MPFHLLQAEERPSLMHPFLQQLLLLLLQQVQEVLPQWVLLLGSPVLTVPGGWQLATVKQLLSSLGFGPAAVRLLAFLGPLGSPVVVCQRLLGVLLLSLLLYVERVERLQCSGVSSQVDLRSL
jgi:hypothetical protein